MDYTPNDMLRIKEQILNTVADYPLKKQFSVRLAKPESWIISPYNPSPESPCPHLLIGRDCALVIDTTDTRFRLRDYIEENLTKKPLKVASTHSHNDHTLANGQFNDCEIYMSQSAWEEIQELRKQDWSTGKLAGYLKGDYIPTILGAGDVIDLGDREIEVLPYRPCHSRTSLIYLDRKYGILFPGDEIDPGQINIWDTPIETFRENLLMLKARSNDFDIICSPHNGTPQHAKILDYYIENCDRIMSGIEGDMDKGSMSYLLNPFEPRSIESREQRRWAPHVRRSEWMGTAINYNDTLIFKSQLDSFIPTRRK